MSDIKQLALYHYDACPYCAMVRQAIKHFDVPIEQRNILKQRQHRNALVKGGGKAQVPCLRIEDSKGKVKWLYESRDIINYLRDINRQQKIA